MTDPKKTRDIPITKAKGRPMLTWVSKKPLARVTAYPAQAIEQFSAQPEGNVGLRDEAALVLGCFGRVNPTYDD